MSTTYSIQLDGTGVSEADAQAAFDDCVNALKAAADEDATGPFGSLTHNNETVEDASDVAP